MDEMGNELEFDDIERRIVEDIPMVGSVVNNAHAEEKGLSSISRSPYEGTSIRKFHSNGNYMDGNISMMSKLQQSSVDQILTRQSAMLDGQSLSLAFEKMNFENGVARAGSGPGPGPAWQSMQSHAVVLEDNYSNNLNNQLNNMDASVLAAWGSSNHLSNGVHDPNMTRFGHQSSLSRHVHEHYRKWQVDQLQPFETSSMTMPLNHEVANVPATNFQFPIASQRQQIFQNGRSPVRYIHPQQVNQQQLGWNYAEEDQLSRMPEQYTYLQNLYNQQYESLLPMQSHENVASRISCQNRKQQYYEVPIAHHLEQSNHEPSWKTCFRRGSNIFSTNYMDTIQGMEKVPFPRKILARNHGLNPIDTLRFMPIGADKSANHVNQGRISRSNSSVRHNNVAQSTDCNCHEHISYSGSADLDSLPDTLDTVDEVRGRIFDLARDQHGCRFLQRKFMEGKAGDIDKIFAEIIDRIRELMVDAFGNYLVQKLLEVCSDDQRMQIIRRITETQGQLILISCDMHGTRAIQKVIETLTNQDQVSMILSSLKSGIVALMKNINGNHVAQHCLDFLMPNCCELLFEAASKNCVELATDRHGCCVLQKCLSCSADRRHRDNLINEITKNALVISQDQYGNYVVQFILKLKLRWASEAILKQLEGNYGDLSMQKYSSNVVEKCLQYAHEVGQYPNIVLELINDPRFDKIMQDPYGNYAIQTALNHTEGTLHTNLVEAIRPLVPVLRMSPYGKKVLAIVGKSN